MSDWKVKEHGKARSTSEASFPAHQTISLVQLASHPDCLFPRKLLLKLMNDVEVGAQIISSMIINQFNRRVFAIFGASAQEFKTQLAKRPSITWTGCLPVFYILIGCFIQVNCRFFWGGDNVWKRKSWACQVQVVGSAVMAFRQICIVLPKDRFCKAPGYGGWKWMDMVILGYTMLYPNFPHVWKWLERHLGIARLKRLGFPIAEGYQVPILGLQIPWPPAGCSRGEARLGSK